jgi:hypothetical protein
MTTDTATQELPKLINDLGVTAHAVQIDHPESAPKWAIGNTNAYRVTIKYDGRRTSLFFYCGYGVKNGPSVADVVYALARDYDSTSYTLEEFGNEFGWNFETQETYRAVKRNGDKFKRLFPNDDVRLSIAESEY